MVLGSLPAFSESGQADGNCHLLRDVCVQCRVRNIPVLSYLATLASPAALPLPDQ